MYEAPFTPEVNRLYHVLIEVAEHQDLISYSACCQQARLPLEMENPYDRQQLAILLARISEYEVDNGRPMLSAVVVHQGKNDPGKGFYTFASELGLLRDRPTAEEKERFLMSQLKEVYATWS